MSSTRKLKLQALATIVVGAVLLAAAVYLGQTEGTSWRSLGLSTIGGLVIGTGIVTLTSTNRKGHQ